jgi:hypothetical protein
VGEVPDALGPDGRHDAAVGFQQVVRFALAFSGADHAPAQSLGTTTMTVSTARQLARLFFACALSFHALVVLAQPKAIFPRSPYTGSPLPVPGRIEAEHYDLGGEGTGYHDTTPGNLGGSFRTDDVDLTGCGDAGCGYQVSWTDTGEWLEYTVNVAQTGVYRLNTRYAAANSLMTLVMEFINPPDELELGGALIEKVDIIELPHTGGYQSWSSVATDDINLTAGTKVLRIRVPSGGVNINWFEFVRNSVPVVTLTAPSHGATFRAPASITMDATAFDSDGAISKVEFYSGTTLLGADQTAPYSFTWGSVPSGSYSLTAKAFDNVNQVTKSPAVKVTVAPSPPGAAQWFIGSGSAYPGGTISVPVWFAGDGNTSDASVDIFFEVSRLGLPVSG